MAFYGKKFKKVKSDRVVELIEKLEVSEKTRELLRRPESLTSFIDNGDGSMQYVVTDGGKEVHSQKIVLGKEADFTLPDGVVSKVTFTLEGGRLKSVLKFPDGKVLHMDREFAGNTMTLYISMEGFDIKASVTYEAV